MSGGRGIGYAAPHLSRRGAAPVSPPGLPPASSSIAPPTKERFIDSGWRLTIPKSMREHLGWKSGTPVCVTWDGLSLLIRSPRRCPHCPDASRMGSLGKIVIPPKIREEASLYQGQVMSLAIAGDHVSIAPGKSQVRCQACGSEMAVKEVLPNVHLCARCRDMLVRTALEAADRHE